MKFKITESIQDRGIFKAIFMAGGPGSGKSYTLSQITDGALSPRVINTDKFVEHFGAIDVDQRPVVLDRVKTLTKNQLYLYLNSMLPMVLDATASAAATIIKRNGLLQSIGYDTGMIFVNTSVETALNRIQQRDRKVPKDWSIQAHEKTMESKKFYKSRFPFFYEIDNDEGELTDQTILQAYKKVRGFYNDPIDNPEGRRNLKIMKQSGWQYMVDGMVKESYLKKLISVWYAS